MSSEPKDVVLAAFGIRPEDATPELTGPPGQDSGVLLAREGFEPERYGNDSWRWVRYLPDGGENLAAYRSGTKRLPQGWWVARWNPERGDECSVQLSGIPSERAAVLFSRMLPDPVEHGFREDELRRLPARRMPRAPADERREGPQGDQRRGAARDRRGRPVLSRHHPPPTKPREHAL